MKGLLINNNVKTIMALGGINLINWNKQKKKRQNLRIFCHYLISY